MTDAPRTLIYTVSRASTPAQLDAAFTSLLHAQSTTGMPHEWLLWCNSQPLLEAARWIWTNGQTWGDGVNKGQHVALAEILPWARREGYQYILKIDDDLEWLTPKWLSRLVGIAQSVHRYSNKHPVLGAQVKGLKNPIPVAMKIQLPDQTRLHVVPIVGGACRLHHISFFDDYIPDVRRALGAGGDTSISQHAERIGVGQFVTPWVRVRHQTTAMEAADPERYINEHALFQLIPFIPHWAGTGVA